MVSLDSCKKWYVLQISQLGTVRLLQILLTTVMGLLLLGSILQSWFFTKHIVGVGKITQLLKSTRNTSLLQAFQHAKQMHLRLIPEPPVKDMCFIAQRPDKDYKFPDPIGHLGHEYLKLRTYPRIPRGTTCHGCCPYIYHNVLQVRDCSGQNSLKLLIIVTTVPWEYSQRQAIRATWGKNTNTTRTLFLLGVGWPSNLQERIIKESEYFGDILQDNYIDSYFNLTLKVLSGYHWWAAHCQRAPFVLRTAADNFIATKTLISFLLSRTYWPDVIIGSCKEDTGPVRLYWSKWFVSLLEFGGNIYPPYCVGTAFVTPANTTRLILKTSPNVPHFVQEDVYFGMVMQIANSKAKTISSSPAFMAHYRKTCNNNSEMLKCSIADGWISIHGVKTFEEMLWISKNCK